MTAPQWHNQPDDAFDPVAMAQEIAPSIKTLAQETDEQAKFPAESLALIRRSGLMGINIPQRYKGHGASIETLSKVAQIIAGACLSTGMIWAMHIQQVACLVDYADETLKARLFPRIAAGDIFVASITSEHGKGGHLFTASAPLIRENEQLIIAR